MMRKFLKTYLFIFLGLVLVCYSLYALNSPDQFSLSKIIIYWSIYSITLFLYSRHNLFLFEPIVLFSFYYYFVFVSAAYMIKTEFTTNMYILNTSFNQPLILLFEKSLLLFFISYLSVVVGYLIFSNKLPYKEILSERKEISSHKLLGAISFLFILIGLLNFLINVMRFSGGDLGHYFSSIASRSIQYESSGGTALFYNLIYVGCYLWFYIICTSRNKILTKICFVSTVIFSVIIMLSQGRIFSTLAYGFSFVGIYYTLIYLKNGKANNIGFILISFSIVLSGLFFYFFRIISSLNENDMLNASVFYYLSQFLTIDMLGYYAVDKGNIPNIGLVMKIIDSWENDIGFLYGQSIFTWVFNLLPSAFRPDIVGPSVMIKQTWYLGMTGGNLPPTGPGEMYANFGMFGSVFGMIYFGGLCALMNNTLKKYNNFWFLCVYILLGIQFFALFPKGEFDNISLFIPILLFLTIFFNKISTKFIISLRDVK